MLDGDDTLLRMKKQVETAEKRYQDESMRMLTLKSKMEQMDHQTTRLKTRVLECEEILRVKVEQIEGQALNIKDLKIQLNDREIAFRELQARAGSGLLSLETMEKRLVESDKLKVAAVNDFAKLQKDHKLVVQQKQTDSTLFEKEKLTLEGQLHKTREELEKLKKQFRAVSIENSKMSKEFDNDKQQLQDQIESGIEEAASLSHEITENKIDIIKLKVQLKDQLMQQKEEFMFNIEDLENDKTILQEKLEEQSEKMTKTQETFDKISTELKEKSKNYSEMEIMYQMMQTDCEE